MGGFSVGTFYISPFAAPAWVLCLANFVLLVYLVIRKIPIQVPNTNSAGGLQENTSNDNTTNVYLAVGLFFFINFVSKGALTLLEAVITPLYQSLHSNLSMDAMMRATSLFYLYIGLPGLLVLGLLATCQLPLVYWLHISCIATAAGSFILSLPEISPTWSLNLGAPLSWSIGAPIADVVCVSAFSALVPGVQGKLMGAITMVGSLGRILFPLMCNTMTLESALQVCGALSCACTAGLLLHHCVFRAEEAEETNKELAT